MTDVGKPKRNPLGRENHFPVIATAEQRNCALRIRKIVYGLYRGIPRTQGTLRSPLCLGLLNICRIPQHYVAKITGYVRGVNRPSESVLIKLRNHPRVVNVGVGKKHGVKALGRNGQSDILKNVLPLLHSAVHQIRTAVHLQERTASRHLVRRTDKLNFHRTTSEGR